MSEILDTFAIPGYGEWTYCLEREGGKYWVYAKAKYSDKEARLREFKNLNDAKRYFLSEKNYYHANPEDKLINLLIKKGFSDGVDINPEVSLYEYGILRRPRDGLVIYSFNPEYKENPRELSYDWTRVELEDMMEALEEAPKGFFEFIGSDKKAELDNLDPNYLSHLIGSFNAYNGYFHQSTYFDSSYEEIYQFAKGD